MWIDSHCHWDQLPTPGQRANFWRESVELGVTQTVIPGITLQQSMTLPNLCAQFPGTYWAGAIHPWFLPDADDGLSGEIRQLSDLLAEPACVALGEFGLDFSPNRPDAGRQKQWFEAQYDLARQLKLPVVLHCVKAHEVILRHLKQAPLSAGGILHGFAGSLDLAKRYADLGIHLGFGAAILGAKAQALAAVLPRLAMESVVLETDTVIGPRRPQRAHSAVPHIAEQLSLWWDISLADVARIVYQNSLRALPKLMLSLPKG
jgi:TatD DNase family protein